MDVALVRWPEEAQRRDALRRSSEPALLLVDPQVPPPEVDDWLEDWIRLPAAEVDVRARVQTLASRATQRLSVSLDPQGRLHRGDRWVALSPLEMRIVEPMVERFGRVTSREAVVARAWPEGLPNRNALDAHLLRLRRRVEAIGLEIRTVRSRGYALQARTVDPAMARPRIDLSAISQQTAVNG